MPGVIEVLLADDDSLLRRAVRDRLTTDDVHVVGEARNGDEAVEMALELVPDIVVMDLLMSGCDGIAATRRIAREAPDIRVVILSGNLDTEAVILALRAGAVGFLGKDIALDALLRTVRGVYRGEAALDRLTTRVLIREFQATSRHSAVKKSVPGDPVSAFKALWTKINAIVRKRRSTRSERVPGGPGAR
jgi:NarL family two-component system response regulator LiaR